jgi:uncharacterized protein (TIGR03067 family)
MAGPDTSTTSAQIDDKQRGIDKKGTSEQDRSLQRPDGSVVNKQTAGSPSGRAVASNGVWAFHTGDFKPDRSLGWTHAFKIKNLDDLIKKMSDEELVGSVSKLAIVAHGDSGGLVQLDPELTEKNVDSFSKDWKRLTQYLTPNAKFMFMSCVAGAGTEGTQLLRAISSYLPGRLVIGFTINGSIRARGVAGDIWEAPKGRTGMNPALFKGEPRMTDESVFAKWVQDGRLVRLPPVDELASLKGKWLITRATTNAKRADQFEGAHAQITLDNIELTKGKKRIWAGTHKLDLLKKPRTIDINFTAGKENGKSVLGILRFGDADFDALTICLAEPSQERPADFDSSSGNKQTVFEMKRETA